MKLIFCVMLHLHISSFRHRVRSFSLRCCRLMARTLAPFACVCTTFVLVRLYGGSIASVATSMKFLPAKHLLLTVSV